MNPKKTYSKFYSNSIPIPPWIEELLSRPWTSAASRQVDRWLWYEEQEFLGLGGKRDA